MVSDAAVERGRVNGSFQGIGILSLALFMYEATALIAEAFEQRIADLIVVLQRHVVFRKVVADLTVKEFPNGGPAVLRGDPPQCFIEIEFHYGND